ncbi:MAG TPA: LacI family DNA-binding transcriptional regulator [Acetobacteraceae bacterium]|nr:LacI family DNA-binding transcriptional regulator [Acetobacteraceae bacterium]
MIEVTLRDVSREAGVSLATADRVLNNRPGVRAKTAERVRSASARLGYRANPFAARLARGASYRLAFVLPGNANPFMAALAAQVRRTAEHLAAQRAYLDIVEVAALDPAQLAATLDRLAGEYHGVAVVALEQPDVQAAIDRLVAAGVAVVTLVSDVPGSQRLRYVGVDNVAAGRTAGLLLGRFATGRAGPVGCVIGSAELHDHAERLQGFTALLAEAYPGLRVLPPVSGRDDDARSAQAAAGLLAEHPDLVGIYAAGAGTAGVARALRQAGRARETIFVAHELSEAARLLLQDGTLDAIINQDAGHEARSAARILLAHLTGEPILDEQERIRIEIFVRENLP